MADALRRAHDDARRLRADNRALRAENAALRAQLAALTRAPPSPAPAPTPAPPPALAVAARASPNAPTLPVEVWIRVCAFLESALDIFAVAGTCRAGRSAACSKGVWREVDLSAVDWERQKRRYAATRHLALVDVTDLTGDAGPSQTYSWVAPRAAPLFAAFLAAHPAAASGITRLALPHDTDRCLEPAALLLRHCTSLQRLLNLNRWSPAQSLALLRVVADARLPVEHLHLNVIVPETVALLLRLPALRSLYYSHHFLTAQTRREPPLDIPMLEALIRRLRLTRLELDVVCAEDGTPMSIESATLTELRWSGKNVAPERMVCPELTFLSLDSYIGFTTSVQRRQLLMAGCPWLRTINGPPAPA